MFAFLSFAQHFVCEIIVKEYYVLLANAVFGYDSRDKPTQRS